jgi:hypothetical protein
MTSQPDVYIVNPHGAVHSVTHKLAEELLQQPGFRLATEAEITLHNEQPIQDAQKNRIAEPWTPPEPLPPPAPAEPEPYED